MPNLCEQCQEPFGEPPPYKAPGVNDCEGCFICVDCGNRYYFCLEDPPVLNRCCICMDKEDEEVPPDEDP